MQKVVIVNGTTDLIEMLERALAAGHYDVVFVESAAHAYSHIKRERPSLVILCLDMRERAGFQVLSMLKLDEATRTIPLLTCLAGYEMPSAPPERLASDEEEISIGMPAASLN